MKSKKTFLEQLLSNWPAKILSLALAILLFWFNRISALPEKDFTIPLEVIQNETYVPINKIPPTNVHVWIRSEKNILDTLVADDFTAYIDLSTYNREGNQKASVILKKRGLALNADPLQSRIEPQIIEIELEQKTSRTVPIEPSLQGNLEVGYELSDFNLNPRSVEITGPRSIIKTINNIFTDNIILTGRKDEFSAWVDLTKPSPFITLLTKQVEFKGIITQSSTIKTFEGIQINQVNLQSNLKIEDVLPKGSIRFEGLKQSIVNYLPGIDLLTIDFTEITKPGTYTLKVLVKAPEGFNTIAYTPENLTIKVIDKPNE